MKAILAKLIFILDRKYSKNLTDLALLIKKCKNVVSDKEIAECTSDIIELNKRMTNHKKYKNSKAILGKLIEYLSDTLYHNEHKFHKPAWNNWNIITRYPDINDYVKIDNYRRI